MEHSVDQHDQRLVFAVILYRPLLVRAMNTTFMKPTFIFLIDENPTRTDNIHGTKAHATIPDPCGISRNCLKPEVIKIIVNTTHDVVFSDLMNRPVRGRH